MTTTTAPKLSKPEMRALVERAEAAAAEAFKAAKPTPMIVGSPRDPVASILGEDDGGLDPGQPIYTVPDGPCGFAWVNVRPGNSRLANYLRAQGKGHTDAYYGGLTVWGPASGHSQSYERKLAAAEAYAAVLREAGFNAYAHGRLD